MAEKLFKDFAPSHGIPMQKDSAEGAKKLDKYAENGYESCALSQREEQDAFSFWWPLVKDCGIRVPETVIIKVPEELDEEGQKTFYRHFYMERPEDYPAIRKWVDDVVIPTLNASPLKGHLLFVKNSLYSNKFDARTCMPAPTPNALTDAIIGIQYSEYANKMWGPYGDTEFVFRDRILHMRKMVPCIYGGLPFRIEFRVFYDFDTHEVIFTANYWDYDYLYPHLYDRTDRIVFDAMRDEMQEKFEKYRGEVEALVAEHMKNVLGLSGPWSIDIMLNEGFSTEHFEKPNEFWLIDMAVAERSAYWEKRPSKLALETVPEKED